MFIYTYIHISISICICVYIYIYNNKLVCIYLGPLDETCACPRCRVYFPRRADGNFTDLLLSFLFLLLS